MSDEKKYTPATIPTKIDVEIFTHYCIAGWYGGEIKNFDEEMTGEDYVLLTKTPLKIKIPKQINIKQKVIEALIAEKKKRMADHEKKMNEIQHKIDSLLALEYKPDEAV